jgi:hypothetical protein
MNRTGVNLVVDLAAAALILAMLATGYILWFALPPGTNKALSLWGLTRHQWGDVHAWMSFGLLGVLFVHLCLHWQWLVSVVRKRLHLASAPHGGLRSGLATFLVVAACLGLFAWATQIGVREITDPAHLDVCPPGNQGTEKLVDATTSVPGVPKQGVAMPPEFWKDVYPVLERSCLSCHGPKRQSGGFRVDRREDFFGTAAKEGFVRPGNSVQSPLIAIVSGQRKDIPKPDAHRLSASDVAVVQAWIDGGAEWKPRPAQE